MLHSSTVHHPASCHTDQDIHVEEFMLSYFWQKCYMLKIISNHHHGLITSYQICIQLQCIKLFLIILSVSILNGIMEYVDTYHNSIRGRYTQPQNSGLRCKVKVVYHSISTQPFIRSFCCNRWMLQWLHCAYSTYFNGQEACCPFTVMNTVSNQSRQ